jgi:hypothetical protein
MESFKELYQLRLQFMESYQKCCKLNQKILSIKFVISNYEQKILEEKYRILQSAIQLQTTSIDKCDSDSSFFDIESEMKYANYQDGLTRADQMYKKELDQFKEQLNTAHLLLIQQTKETNTLLEHIDIAKDYAAMMYSRYEKSIREMDESKN